MHVAACPSPTDLEGLFLGGLPEKEVALLEQHVLECASCLAKLKKLLRTKETLAGLLRDDTKSDAPADSPVVVALMKNLESVRSVSPRSSAQGPAMLVFQCSGCHKNLTAAETLAGKKVKCPGCGQVTVATAKVAIASPVHVTEQPTLLPEPFSKASNKDLRSQSSGRPDATEGLGDPDPGCDDSFTDFLAPPQAEDELGRLGKYRILAILGHGGMGVVFKAEDPKLKRSVALKAMLPTLAASASAGKRFQREAQAMAAVEHDHIVRIYQVDEERGVPFLAMEFLKGEPLDERLKGKEQLPLREVLRIGREIAEALDAAHATGLIHRDVKPANIWLEAPRNRVKILDFGLARAAAQDAGLTQQGAIVGTPAYMAPEQARGEAVDARCDLFSLGVLLYRLCTGQEPFRGTDTISTLMAVTTHDPVSPVTVNADLPQELSDLVMKLLAKDPALRIASAAEVVQAIRRLERDPAISPGDFTEILRSQALAPRQDRAAPRRGTGRRAVWTAVLLGVLGLGAVAAGAVVYRIQTNHGELIISTDNPDVEVIVRKAGKEVSILDTRTGKQFTLHAGAYDLELKGKKEEGLTLVPRHVTIHRGETVLATITHTKKASPVAVKPELLYSLPWKDEKQTWIGQANLWYTQISSDGRLFLAGGDTGPAGPIRVCDLATGRQVQVLVPGGDPWYFSARFLPGSKQIVASYNKMKDLYLWDIASGRVVCKFIGHNEPGPNFTVSPDGKRILSWSADKTVRLWNVETGKELKKLDAPPDTAAGVFSPDSKQTLTFGPDKTLRLWSVETGKELNKLEGHTDACTGSFSPDGKQALSYGPDGTIRLWSLATGKEIRRFEGRMDKVSFAGFVAGSRLIVGSGDRKYRIWEAASGKLVREFDYTKESAAGWNLTASPDGRLALMGNDHRSVRLLDLTTGKEIHRFENCPYARAFSYSPDGTLAVAGSFRHGVYVFRLPTPAGKAAAAK